MRKLMMMTSFGLAPMICREADGVAGGGDGGGVASGDAGAGDVAADAGQAKTALDGAFDGAPDGNAQDAGADGADDAAAGADAGVVEPFAFAAPEGMESFAGDYEGYGTAVNAYLTENPNATAREALAWAAQHQTEQVKAAAGAMEKQFNDTVARWDAESLADPEFGAGDTAKRDKEVAAAISGLQKFGTPELLSVLNESGLGSNVHVLKAFAKIGKLTQESVILGGEGGKGNVSFASSMYGTKG